MKEKKVTKKSGKKTGLAHGKGSREQTRILNAG